MDTSLHNLPTLFAQLGLPGHPEDIETFISTHPVGSGIPIFEALFWLPTQAAFLKSALEDDSDWCETIDELASLLARS